MSERMDWGRGVAKVKVLFDWDGGWDPDDGCCCGGPMVKCLTGGVRDVLVITW